MDLNVNTSPVAIQQAETASAWNGGVTKICQNVNEVGIDKDIFF